jgi:hypothetical protein
MMGPDYTHWHGTYDIAKNFYHGLLPELEELVQKGLNSKNKEKKEAAGKLQQKIIEVLNSPDHKWYLNKK